MGTDLLEVAGTVAGSTDAPSAEGDIFDAEAHELAFYKARCVKLEDDLARERKAARAVRQILATDMARRLVDKLDVMLRAEDDLK